MALLKCQHHFGDGNRIEDITVAYSATINLVRLGETGGGLVQVASIEMDQRARAECPRDTPGKSKSASKRQRSDAFAQRIIPLSSHQIDENQAVAGIYLKRWCTKLSGQF